MIDSSSMRLDGVITFWTKGSFYDFQKLKDGYEALSLGDLAPALSTADANLQYALRKVYDNTGLLVRSSDGGFNIVKEERGEKGTPNRYEVKHAFWLDGVKHNELMMSPPDYDKAKVVAERFNEFCSLVPLGAVTRSLVAVVDKLKGIPLSPTGGFYWLPAAAVDTWSQLGRVIEGASAYGQAVVYLVRHSFDHDAVRAVRDALVADAEAEAKRIEKEVMEDDLGEKALNNRKDQANEIMDKLSLYESILGETLEGIKGHLGSVGEMAAVAAVRAAAAQYNGAAT